MMLKKSRIKASIYLSGFTISSVIDILSMLAVALTNMIVEKIDNRHIYKYNRYV